MKTKIKLLSLSGVIMFLGFMAANTQAVNSDRADRIENRENKIEERKAAVETKKTEKICERVDAVLTRLESKIGKNNKEDKLKERVQNRVREMEENRAKRDDDLGERREMRDQNREDFYNELEEKAGDDTAKKAAVEKFKSAVEVAVKTRREAIDNAKKTMNEGIDKAIATRETSMVTLRNEFRKNIEVAITKAKGSCGDDANSEELKSVMNQLKNDIKANRETYKTDTAEIKKVQETIQSLRETRKASVKLAIENFKAAMKIAQEELRVAMGE